MKKITALTIAALVAFGLVIAPPAQASSKKNDDLYVKVIRSEAPILRGVPKRDLIKGAKTTCRYLRSGNGILDAVNIALDAGLSRNVAYTLVAGAVVFYCPEQEGNY
jgi:hypothetical protein